MNDISIRIIDFFIIVPPKKERYIDFANMFVKNPYDYSISISPVKIIHYIKCFPQLPNLALDYFKLSEENLKTDGLFEIFQTYKTIYNTISLWMIYYNQGLKHEILDEKPYTYYQHDALIYMNHLKLIQDVFGKLEKVDKGNILLVSTAPKIWFSCAFAGLVNSFLETGFLFKKPTVDTSGNICKKAIQHCKDTIKEIDDYYNREPLPVKSTNNKKNSKSKDNYLWGIEIIEDIAKELSFKDEKFFKSCLEKYLKDVRNLNRKIKDTEHFFTFYRHKNAIIRDRKQGKFTSKSHGYGNSKTNTDWESMPSQQLKNYKSRNASEEKLKRCFQAIVNHNQKVSPDVTKMFRINDGALRDLSSCSLNVVKKWIVENQEAIDKENQKFGLSRYQNRGRDITQAIDW